MSTAKATPSKKSTVSLPEDDFSRSIIGFFLAMIVGALIPRTIGLLVRRVFVRAFREVFVLAVAGILTDRLTRIIAGSGRSEAAE
ncbi:MAG: hypothetical protein OXT73_10240 [Bacteroidota bacterium]|nr:hypothetical protein [Bacteroidota bacterium]